MKNQISRNQAGQQFTPSDLPEFLKLNASSRFRLKTNDMKTSNLATSFHVAAIAATLLTLPGIGCGSTTKVTSDTSASVGQQLLDLEKAHSNGVINDKEYEKLRKSIVKKHD